jgi:pyruvate kinase
VAHTIGARAIAAFTTSGASALRVARQRPEPPVLAITPSTQTARRLSVAWGIHAVVTAETHTMTETVSRAIRIARQEGVAAPGDTIIVVAGVPFGQAGSTNALRVARVK